MRELWVVGAALVDAQGRCFVARRGPQMSAAGLWEFPGGKVEAGEAPQEALRRELQEELGVQAWIGALLGRGEQLQAQHQRRIVLDVYLARLLQGQPVLREHDQGGWLDASQLPSLGWAPPDIPILPALLAHLRGLQAGVR